MCESDRLVERHGLRIGDHVDSRRAALTRNPRRVLHESAPDARAHPIRLDEQTIKVIALSGALEDHGEADDRAALLSAWAETRRELLHRQLDHVRLRLRARRPRRRLPGNGPP